MRSSWKDVSSIRLYDVDAAKHVVMCTLDHGQWTPPKHLLICNTMNLAIILPLPNTSLTQKAPLPFWKVQHHLPSVSTVIAGGTGLPPALPSNPVTLSGPSSCPGKIIISN